MIERLLGPSLECAQLVYEELKRMIYNLNLPELRRFNNLSCQINTILEKMLSELMIPTCSMINNIFEVELGHINTRHPDFILGAKDSLSGKDKNDDDRNKPSRDKRVNRDHNGLHDAELESRRGANQKYNDDLTNSVTTFS